MTLADNLSQLMALDQDGANAEINLKVKPLTNSSGVSALASDPTSVGAGGDTGGGASSPGTVAGPGTTPVGAGGVDTATTPELPTGFGPGGESAVPVNQRVTRQNPTLVTHPLGARTDDIYEAAVAQLQNQTQQQYLNYLQDLGWIGDNGQFTPGNLETQAIRDRAEIARQRDLKLQDIIEGAVRGGTVFSGRRAQLQQQGVQPFDTAAGNLETTLSRELSKRYEGLGDLSRQFELSRDQLVADAAARYAASLQGGPAGGGDVSTDGGGAPPAPPPEPNYDGDSTLYDPRAAAAAYNAQNIIVPKALWLSLHPGGSYDNYRKAWLRQRNPVYSGGGGGGGGGSPKTL
jgi:hypothetical protein